MSETNGTADARPPLGLVVGITPGDTRTEPCYLCDKPVLVSASVAAEMAERTQTVQYAHAACQIDVMKRVMELHGVDPR